LRDVVGCGDGGVRDREGGVEFGGMSIADKLFFPTVFLFLLSMMETIHRI